MLIWCITLFALGVFAFLDTIFSYGEIFRRVNSVVFMLLSLGLLVRTSTLMRLKKNEGLVERNAELEKQVGDLKQASATTRMEPEKVG